MELAFQLPEYKYNKIPLLEFKIEANKTVIRSEALYASENWDPNEQSRHEKLKKEDKH